MTDANYENIRIDSSTVQDLRQYCLDVYGKTHGHIGREAAHAIKSHIHKKTTCGLSEEEYNTGDARQ